MRTKSAKIVSFCGVDGAGKSTQIQALEDHLRELGFRSKLYRFWDDVAVFSGLREFLSHKAFGGDKGVGSPEKPINRRDKNVTSWYATAVRLFFYLLDALSLRLTLATKSPGDTDFVIFDRYIYDELANLPLHYWLMRVYVRMILKISPRPDVAYLVDADPAVARTRKPEYPLEFLRRNRNAYITLSHLVEGMKVVSPGSIDETTSAIIESILQNCLRAHRQSFDVESQCPARYQDAPTPHD